MIFSQTVSKHQPQTVFKHQPQTVSKHQPQTVSKHQPQTVFKHQPQTVSKHQPQNNKKEVETPIFINNNGFYYLSRSISQSHKTLTAEVLE